MSTHVDAPISHAPPSDLESAGTLIEEVRGNRLIFPGSGFLFQEGPVGGVTVQYCTCLRSSVTGTPSDDCRNVIRSLSSEAESDNETLEDHGDKSSGKVQMLPVKVSAMALVDDVFTWLRVLRVDILLIVFLIYKFHRRIYVFLKCFRRDLRFFKQMKEVAKIAKTMEAEDETEYSAFHKLAVSRPNDICLYWEEKNWTYRDVEDFADRIAQVASADGFKKGDTIALVMGNRPEYLCIRLGLAQLGVIISLININLRDRPLEHTIEIVSSKAIIVEGEFAYAIDEILSAGRLTGIAKVYQFEGKILPGSDDLKARMEAAPPGRPEVPDPPHHHDTTIYVYSSGTTGLPKACVIKHSKMLLGPWAFKQMLSLKPEKDVIYTCMPLYHLAGGGYGLGNATVTGVPVAIARKFSASRFWSDCAKFNVTTAQYIGEMCRFLMTQPPRPSDRAHKVKILVGNGIRSALWKPLQERFNIPLIVEVYGSTEGNSNLLNSIGSTVGAVGFIPRIIPLSFWPNALVRVDQESEELVRGPDGLCQRCKIGEPGIYIGRISNDPGRGFDGYVDKEATQKKIARNVFKQGDKWYNSGDLLVMDELGYISFIDRCGDTYRWKGENVSAAEIEEIIKCIVPGKPIAVYGVEIPGNEGRCGMTAIEDVDGTVDQETLDKLADGMKRSIAPYARPLFVRITKKIPILNGTLKVQKNVLRKESYDPTKLSDPVYFLDPKTVRYVRLTENMCNDLNAGLVRI